MAGAANPDVAAPANPVAAAPFMKARRFMVIPLLPVNGRRRPKGFASPALPPARPLAKPPMLPAGKARLTSKHAAEADKRKALKKVGRDKTTR
jgi:hypothetical protein